MLALPAFRRRFRRISLPATLLVALLQRLPALRLAIGAGEYVLRAPLGQLLRGAVAAAAAGALHTLAGATTFVISRPSPISGTVGQPLSPDVVFTYAGTPSEPQRFVISGSLPPGLTFVPAPVNGSIFSSQPRITGTPTQAGSYSIVVHGVGLAGEGGDDIVDFTITGGSGSGSTAPAITTAPQSQSVTAGANVTFSVAATGQPAPTYQWRKNGQPIAGASASTLTLGNVQASDAGAYTVVIANSAGSIESPGATLTVNAATGGGGGGASIAFTAQPVSQTVSSGSTAVFNAAATGATGYQWQRNGAAIAGATGATLVIENADTSKAGSYSVVASGGGASGTSNPATLGVRNESNFGRLVNLSILTDLPVAGEAGAFTMGYVVGPLGASTPKPLVIRAAGPSLGALGVPGTASDPKLELFAGSAPNGGNDNWGGGQKLVSDLAAVGAFPYIGPGSLDAAVSGSMPAGGNSVKVSATAPGTVIAEVYDADSAATPRLINVSVLKPLSAGAKLTAGFVLRGNTARTVLIRAIGPGLATVGVSAGFLPDPQLALFAGSTKMLENDNWGGDAQLAATFSRIGAFAVPATSKDAVLLVTLAPGNYSAEVTGSGEGGLVLVEVYEVP